ncbi:MAG TPA: hypothetical protein VGZ29_11190 [Terriglobia bacterium]|nr:hypothetical protein [Terriglobia bacterium]
MDATRSDPSPRIATLVAFPAILTLAVTILRLVGELQHWGSPWVVNSRGGSALTVLGVTWLPLLFGPYFAWKLIKSGFGPSSVGAAVAAAFGSVVVFLAGSVVAGYTETHPGILTLVGFLIALAAAFIPGKGWRALGVTLLTYAFAARIPVAIVMLIAMSAHGGQGLGTHYDAVGEQFSALASTWQRKFVLFGLIPQMTLWIGSTAAVGSLIGTLLTAIFGFGKRPATA